MTIRKKLGIALGLGFALHSLTAFAETKMTLEACRQIRDSYIKESISTKNEVREDFAQHVKDQVAVIKKIKALTSKPANVKLVKKLISDRAALIKKFDQEIKKIEEEIANLSGNARADATKVRDNWRVKKEEALEKLINDFKYDAGYSANLSAGGEYHAKGRDYRPYSDARFSEVWRREGAEFVQHLDYTPPMVSACFTRNGNDDGDLRALKTVAACTTIDLLTNNTISGDTVDTAFYTMDARDKGNYIFRVTPYEYADHAIKEKTPECVSILAAKKPESVDDEGSKPKKSRIFNFGGKSKGKSEVTAPK